MDTNYQKRLAAKIMKCGISRVRVDQAKEVGEALTREDVRGLIKKGLIRKIPKRGVSRVNARKILLQKSKGRRLGTGSIKGAKKARTPKKGVWMANVRGLRSLLKELREREKIDNKTYKMLYGRIKGGYFRNRQHLLLYLKDTGVLKSGKGV